MRERPVMFLVHVFCILAISGFIYTYLNLNQRYGTMVHLMYFFPYPSIFYLHRYTSIYQTCLIISYKKRNRLTLSLGHPAIRHFEVHHLHVLGPVAPIPLIPSSPPSQRHPNHATTRATVPFPQLGVGQQRSRCLLGTCQPVNVVNS